MDIFQEATKSDLAHCFVPELLTNYIRKSVREGKNKIEPTSFFLKGVCLLVDISGFTMMSEQFCVQGKNGIDGLQRTTNGYMGKLVDVIYQFGGDIIKFAGDAVVCVFASENFAEENHIPVEVILRAMHCAHVIRDVRTDSLTVHVAMSCGEMCFGILGGYENSWECLISGPCIHQLSDCLDDAPSMSSVLSPECSAILKQHQTTSMFIPSSTATDPPSEQARVVTSGGTYQYRLLALPSGNVRIVDVTFEENESAVHNQSFSPRAGFAKFNNTISAKIGSPSKKILLSSRQKGQIDQLIRLFVPKPIGEELDNATGLNYFAEIREVTTMFMKWDSYDAADKHRDLLDLQPCFYQAQRILHTTGGYLRQFLVDDKGCVLIACWGMPHMSYVDNAHRAMSASAQIQQELCKLGMLTSVGITAGDVYCGTVGSYKRMEYAAIACCVNMSARLMGKAKGRLLIGQSAYMRLPKSAHALLQAIEPMMVKGKATPLQAYKYIGAASTSTDSAGSDCNSGVPIAGGSGSGRAVRSAVEDGEQIPESCRVALLALLTRMSTPAVTSAATATTTTSSSATTKATTPVNTSTTASDADTTTCVPDPNVACVDCLSDIPLTTVTTTTTSNTNNAHTNTTSTSATTTNPSATPTNKSNRNALSSWLAFPSFTLTKATTTSCLPVVLISGNEGSGRTSAAMWLKSQAIERKLSVFSLRMSKKDTNVDFSLWKRLFPLLMPKDLFLNNETQRMHVLKLLHSVFPDNALQVEHQAFPALKTALGVTCTFADAVPNVKKLTKKGTWSSSIDTFSATLTHIGHLTVEQYQNVPVIDTLRKVFEYLLTTTVTLCIVENIESADDESLLLLSQLLPLQTTSSFVLTTLLQATATSKKKRVGGFLLPKKYQQDAINSTIWSRVYRPMILKHKGTTSITLTNYTPEEIDKLLTRALGGQVVPDLAQLVLEFSGGSCFWVREIIQCIKDNGSEQFMMALSEGDNAASFDEVDEAIATTSVKEYNYSSKSTSNDAMHPSERSIRVKPRTDMNKGKSAKAKGVANKPALFSTISFYEANSTSSQMKLDKLVLCRLNGLSTDAQRILRTSSIIGYTFSAKVLHEVLPRHLKEGMDASLEALCRRKWLYQDTDCETNYRFAHTHAHRVIYQLTPLSERNLLHRSIADHIVATYPDDTTQYASICYHYQHCASALALQYLVKAVHVTLQTDDVFDYGDCIEMMYGTFPCVQTISDVEVLMKLVQEVAQGIQQCNTSNADNSRNTSAVGAFLASLFVLAVGKSSDNKHSVKVVPTNTDSVSHASSTDASCNSSDSNYKAVYSNKDLDLSENTGNDIFNTSFETETDDGESDLDPTLSAVDIETRTKRSFLSQLERLNDQLTNKLTQFERQNNLPTSADTNVCNNDNNMEKSVEPGINLMADWQKVYLCKV